VDPAQYVRQNMMVLCFTLALIQMSIGHVYDIFHCKNLKALGDIGQILMLCGMYQVILGLVVSGERFPINMPMAVGMLGAGFVLNFIFGGFETTVGASVKSACVGIISQILGIANIFSDIMSYIRLWAVGMAGGAIASVVDTMAGPMLGQFALFIFGILILGVGHGLNLALNLLSVLVHGVRLNTLEFSTHAGLSWTGHRYEPFRVKN
jgi:V/A-type H+-transporting ATPase subunit I